MKSSVVACLAGVAVVVSVIVTAVPAAELPSITDRWFEVSSGDLTFISSRSERATRRMAAELEKLRGVLAKLAGLELTAPAPMVIYVFSNEKEFTPYKSLYMGRPAAMTGSYTRHDEIDLIAMNGGAVNATGVLYHEYVHFFLAHNAPELPLWFEEGLAELYRTFTVTPAGVRVGDVLPGRLRWLRSHRMAPLGELLTVNRGSPAYNERRLKDGFYSQAWALTHYLLIGNEARRPQLVRYLDLLHRGVPSHQALLTAFDADERALLKELKRYLARRSLPHGLLPVDVGVEATFTVRPLSSVEVLYRLGELLGYQRPGRRQEAASHFRAALEVDPDYGPALAGLALVAESQARWDDARELYSRAAKGASEDPLVQYRHGVFLLSRDGDLEGGIAALKRSTEIRPGFGLAWAALTAAHAASRDVSAEALRAGETAVRLLPGRYDVVTHLVRLYLRAGRRVDALRLTEASFARGGGLWRRSRTEIARDDLARARRLLAAGRLDAAEEVLDGAQADLGDVLRDGRAADRLRELRSDLAGARLAARFDEAVALLEAGDAETARALLEDVIARAPDGHLATRARVQLNRIDRGDKPANPLPPEGISERQIEGLNRHLAVGNLDGALTYLEGLRTQATANQHRWIDDKIAEVERARAHNRFVESYNLAVELYNSGQHADAIGRLEIVDVSELDPSDAAALQDLLVKARLEARGGP